MTEICGVQGDHAQRLTEQHGHRLSPEMLQTPRCFPLIRENGTAPTELRTADGIAVSDCLFRDLEDAPGPPGGSHQGIPEGFEKKASPLAPPIDKLQQPVREGPDWGIQAELGLDKPGKKLDEIEPICTDRDVASQEMCRYWSGKPGIATSTTIQCLCSRERRARRAGRARRTGCGWRRRAGSVYSSPGACGALHFGTNQHDPQVSGFQIPGLPSRRGARGRPSFMHA